MKTLLMIVAFTGILTSCAVNPQTMKATSDMDLCKEYGTARNGILKDSVGKQYEEEIKKRDLIHDEDWPDVRIQQIHIGMSECALYASWGVPTGQNVTAVSGSQTTQHIFGGDYGRYSILQYVYTENGKITAVQSSH